MVVQNLATQTKASFYISTKIKYANLKRRISFDFGSANWEKFWKFSNIFGEKHAVKKNEKT